MWKENKVFIKIYCKYREAVKENTKISKTYPYKANDITVNSAETLISNFIKNILEVFINNINIRGGNIGFKLGLKLNESGSNIYLYRRDKKVKKNGLCS